MRVPMDTDALARIVQRNWLTQVGQMQVSSQRLATGARVASALDDAAGVSISARHRAFGQGAQQAARNAQAGVAVARVGDGALASMTSMLQRMRSLAVASANGTFSAGQRAGMQQAVVLTLDEMDAVVRRTHADGVRALDGQARSWQLGPQASDAVELAAPDGAAVLAASGGINIDSQEGAVSALDALDEALQTLFAQRAKVAAMENRLTAAARNLAVLDSYAQEASARGSDVDVAWEAGAFAQATLFAQVGALMMAQVTQVQRSVLTLLRPAEVDGPGAGTGQAPVAAAGVSGAGSGAGVSGAGLGAGLSVGARPSGAATSVPPLERSQSQPSGFSSAAGQGVGAAPAPGVRAPMSSQLGQVNW